MAFPTRATVVEVGPRDGLQNESATIATADKIAFTDALSAAGPAGHRSLRICQPEMGAADGRCRGRLRRDCPAPFHPIHCARSESCRSRPGASRRCDRSRGVRGRVRVLQPPQYQPVDRRLLAGLPRGLRARTRTGACGSAGTCQPRSAARSKATSRRRASPQSLPPSSRWAASKSRSATRSG